MRIKEIAAVRPSWGSPRIHVLLRREGWPVNHKRTQRLYRLEGLNLRRNPPRRRNSVVTRGPVVMPTCRDERWSMDFMHDQLQDGRRIRVLTVVDQYTREALATEARGSFSAHDVIDVLNRLSRSHRKPAVIQGRQRDGVRFACPGCVGRRLKVFTRADAEVIGSTYMIRARVWARGNPAGQGCPRIGWRSTAQEDAHLPGAGAAVGGVENPELLAVAEAAAGGALGPVGGGFRLGRRVVRHGGHSWSL